MNKLLKNIFTWLALLLPCVSLAQEKLYKVASPYERYTSYAVTLRGGLGLPMAGLKDYIDQSSLKNYSISGEFVLKNRLSFGATLGYNYFKKQVPRQVYHFNNTDVSAVQTRTLTNYSLLATGSYHLANINAPLRPYIQVGIGLVQINYVNYFGILSDSDTGFRLQVRPTAGVRLLFGKDGKVGSDAQVSLAYSPYEYDYMKNYAALSVSVGLYYRWW